MEVEVYSTAVGPLGDLIRNIRERTEEFLFFLHHLIAASITLLESPMVKLIQFIRNALPEIREGVIHVVPAPGNNGGGDLSDRALYRRFLLLIGNF